MSHFVNPRFQAFYTDSSGYLRPCAGYLLYSYEPGTTTPKTTYRNKQLTAAHVNPIVLNPDGTALVYLSGSTKFILKTPEGLQVSGWPVDSVDGVPGSGDTATFSGLTVTGAASISGDTTIGGDVSAASAAISGAITGASAAVTGDVSAETATMTGAITGGSVTVTGNVSAVNVTASGVVTSDTVMKLDKLNAVFTDSAITGTIAETDHHTYTIPGTTLSVDGTGLKFRALGAKTGTAGNLTLKLMIGSTVLLTATAFSSAEAWKIEAEIYRTGSATARYFARAERGGAYLTSLSGEVAVVWADDQVLKVTATLANTGDTSTEKLTTLSFIND